MTNKELLRYLEDIREEAIELTKYSREETRLMYDYLSGDQLPWDVINTLRQRGQPIKYENIIREIDNSLDGLKRMSQTEISVIARNDADKERAEILEKIHKSTIDSTEWAAIKARADLDLRVAGLSVIESALHHSGYYDKFGKPIYDIKRTHIPAVECLIDMYSRAPDYSDARYFMHERLYDKQGLIDIYGEKAKKLVENEYGMVWINRAWYRKDGEIYIATFGDGVLLENIKQPYTKTRGRFSVSVRRTNFTHKKEYYGIYRDVKPFQDDINNLMLRLKNMLGSYKMLIENSAVDDIETFAEDFSLDNSVTVVNDGALREKRFHEINLNTNISQIMALIRDARAKALQVVGVNPEILGSSTTRQSGVALEIKQNAALVGMQRYLSNSNELDKDIFEIETAIIEEHYKAEQVFVILGEDKEKQSFYINEYLRDDKGRIIFKNGKPVQKSILNVGRYDFIITQVPFNNGSADAKMKNWAEVMKVIDPSLAQNLIPAMLEDIGSKQAKIAKEIIEQHEKAQQNSPEAQQQMQLQMQQIQLQMQEAQAKIEELMSKANLNNAKVQEIIGEVNPNIQNNQPQEVQ